MGDLMFNRRHPVVDRPAGASMKKLDLRARSGPRRITTTTRSTSSDTPETSRHRRPERRRRPPPQHVPGHGPARELMLFRDYLTALLTYVQAEIKSGKTRDESSRFGRR
jgi:hypothetical protein